MITESILPDDWIKAGYRRYDHSAERREFHKLSDFLLQKLISDEYGKKYYITVYCYDRKRYPIEYQRNVPEFGFMPTVQFSLGSGYPTFDIEMNSVSNIDEVEEYYEKFWVMLGKPYYDKYLDDELTA